MIESDHKSLSVSQQCEMVNIPRSSYYSSVQQHESQDEAIVKRINTIYEQHPEYGSRRIRSILERQGDAINRKRVQRIMRTMNIQGICPKKNLSKPHDEHKKYSFIARRDPIVRIDQVWSTDITYIKTQFGYAYLVAVIDWYSRLILSWNMSNNMGEEFCIAALEHALKRGCPGIFNTDQGSQFTGNAFINTLLDFNIEPSMDGKGRATDNAQIERFWRSVKWEELFLYEPQTYSDLRKVIHGYIKHYNHERPHQSLDYKTPSEVHFNLEKKAFDLDARPIYTDRELEYALNL